MPSVNSHFFPKTKKNEISLQKIEWMTSSTVDPVGRVFAWKQNIYRAIRPKYTSFFKDLFKQNILDDLYRKGQIIKTSETTYSLKNYGMVMQHDRISFPTYPFEWCGEMLKDAALLICNLSLALDSCALELKDVHPYNIMFEDYLPKYIDIGSFIPKTGQNWSALNSFILNLMYPLYCYSEGKGNEVRQIFRDELDGKILNQKITKLISVKNKLKIKFDTLYSPNTYTILKKLKYKIENLKFMYSETPWSFYSHDADYILPFDNKNRWFKKQKNIYKLLKNIKPTSVLDLGSNVGWYSELAARLGAKVVATDIDEPSLSVIYQKTKKTKLTILPLMVDFMKSTASNIAWSGASKRLRCDGVLALALIHHLVFKDHLYFDTIARELDKFSKKWAIIEFIPPNDKYIKNWLREEHDWYSLNNFLDELYKFYKKIDILDSAPYPRKLLFCRK